MNDLEYCCPRCHGPLASDAAAYQCLGCVARYPVLFGIPDFRVYPDLYISIENDHRKGGLLVERYAESTFRELVEFYWSITPDTPAEMASRFTEHAVAGIKRGDALLDDLGIPSALSNGAASRRALDIGSRTGGTLAALSGRFAHVVGIDIAFRWLITARKLLEESGQRAQLVCCCAENLPFAPGAFDFAFAENVIEHTREPAALIKEARRILAPNGMFAATTWNRISPTPEPHVRLFGVGYLPRNLQKRYVKRFRGQDYDHVRLISAFGLKRIVNAAGFHSSLVSAAALTPAQVATVPRILKPGIALFNVLRKVFAFRTLLAIIAPTLWLVAKQGAGSQVRKQ